MIYKILDGEAWRARGTSLPWAPVDQADGFVHFSSAEQLVETAQKHFSGRNNLVLVEVDDSRIEVRWEPSRGGALFPHVYGDVPLETVRRTWDMPQGFELPADF